MQESVGGKEARISNSHLNDYSKTTDVATWLSMMNSAVGYGSARYFLGWICLLCLLKFLVFINCVKYLIGASEMHCPFR